MQTLSLEKYATDKILSITRDNLPSWPEERVRRWMQRYPNGEIHVSLRDAPPTWLMQLAARVLKAGRLIKSRNG